MASRRLEDLNEPTRIRAERFEQECEKQGLDILIYCTYRSVEEQNELYAQGRTKPGSIVTNARGGESWHNWRCAFDFVTLKNGKAQWGDRAAYAKAGAIAESVGLEWAGRWKGKLRETAHCQYRGGLTMADMKAGKQVV